MEIRIYNDLTIQDLGNIFLVFEEQGNHTFNRMFKVISVNPTSIQEFLFDGTLSATGVNDILNDREIVGININPDLGLTLRKYIPSNWSKLPLAHSKQNG